MTKFENLSWAKKTAILSGLLLQLLLVCTSIGYLRGLLGDSGSSDRAIDWAVKTALLWILLIIISMVFGRIQVFLESNWKIPFIPSFAIIMGFLLAIVEGANVLLDMNSGEFWTTILSGFVQGILVGGLGAISIQITDKKNENDNSTEAGKNM